MSSVTRPDPAGPHPAHSDPAGPHPVTGQLFPSPVPAGSGWPGDVAGPRTPRAGSGVDVARLAASAADVATVDARVSACRACPRLVAWREQVATTRRAAFADQPYWGRPVPGFGDPAPRLLVVGLAPAAHGANRTGRMFTGDRSGDWIYAALHRAGYAGVPYSRHAGDGQHLDGARIVAAVRCAPPANAPTGAERATCAPWLDRDVELARPTLRAVLALGAIGFAAFLGSARRLGWAVPRPSPRFGHGVEVAVLPPAGAGARPDGQVAPDGQVTPDEQAAVSVLASYHVSQQNTFTGRLTEAMLDDVLTRARQLTDGGS
ncbi:MAG: uracil-DNA glycosylase [Angustibacter sp.]